MKKVVVAIVALVILIAIGVYVVVSNLDSLVKAAIEQYGSEVTQTAVRVNRVKIDLKQGSGAIYGLTVANPAGFEARQAFSLGETSLKLDLKSLNKQVIVIDAVTVRAPKVSYEMNAAREGSLNKLYDNISKSLPKDSRKADTKAGGPKMIVRSLVLEGGAIDARLVPVDKKNYNVKLPDIRMSNLGAPNGATGGELAKEILARITRTARDEVKKQLIDGKLKGAIAAERKKLEGATQQKVDEQKKNAEQRLKDMLKR